MKQDHNELNPDLQTQESAHTADTLKGRVALVTGASGLLGQAICIKLASMGTTVIAVYGQNTQAAEALQSTIQDANGVCEIVSHDLTHANTPKEIVTDVLKTHKRLDIVVACAGITVRKSALMTSSDETDQLFNLNFRSAVDISRIAMRVMMRTRWGRVITVGSRAGGFGMPGQAVYAGTKAALEGWTRSVASEVGAYGITVNVLAPGAIKSPDDAVYSADEEAEIISKIGLKRLADPQDIAAAVGFLASPDASYVSGTTLVVDGAARF